VADALGLPPSAVASAALASSSGAGPVAGGTATQLEPGGGGVLLSTGLASDDGAGSTDLLGDGLPDRTTLTLTLNIPPGAVRLVYTSQFATTEHDGPNPVPQADAATVTASTGASAVVLGAVGPSPAPHPAEQRTIDVSSVGAITLVFTVEDAGDGLDDSSLHIGPLSFVQAAVAPAADLAAALFPGETVLSANLAATSGTTTLASVLGAEVIPGGALLSTGLAADGGAGSTDFASDGAPDRTSFRVTLAVPPGRRSLVYSAQFSTAEFSAATPNADSAAADSTPGGLATLGLVGPFPVMFPQELRAVDVAGAASVTIEYSVEDAGNGLLDSGLRLTNGFFTDAEIATAAELAAALVPGATVLSSGLEGGSGEMRIVDVLSAAPGALAGSVLLSTGFEDEDGLGDRDVGEDDAPDSTALRLNLAVPQDGETKSLVYSTRFVTSEKGAASPGADRATAASGATSVSAGSVSSSVTGHDPPVTRAIDVAGLLEVEVVFSVTDDADLGARDSGLLVYGVYFSEFEASLLNDPRPADAKLQTGTYAWSKSLISAVGPMLPFGFMVHYSSAPRRTSGVMGPNWGHNYDWAVIEVEDGDRLVRRGDGRIETFEPDPADPTRYLPDHGQIFNRLLANPDGTYEYRTTEQFRYSFDADGRLVAIADAGGNQATLTHADGHLASVTDTRGQTGTFTFDAGGKLTGVAYAFLSVSLAYTGDDLTEIIGPDGNSTNFTYDGGHHLLTGTNALGIVFVTNTYDDLHRVTQQVDANLATSTTVYETSTTTHLDPLGNQRITTFDPLDRQVAIEDDTGAVRSYGYDEDDNVVAETDPLGATNLTDYDDHGSVIGTVDALSGTTTHIYDDQQRPVSSTDELGAAISFIYDFDGNLAQDLDPLGVPKSYGYDSRGLRTSSTDRNGNLYQYVFDAEGDLVQAIDPLGGVSTFEHDELGREIASYDENGNGVFLTVDAYGRTTATTDALGFVYSQVYDAEGQLIAETDTLGATSTFEYGPTGRLVRVTDPLGASSDSAYDANDQLVSVTDPLGRTTSFGYDGALRHVATTDALGGTAAVEYDAAGNRTGVTDPLGRLTSYLYDALGTVIAEIDPLGRVCANTFDARGQVATITNARGQTLHCEYDAAARLIAIHRSDHTVQYTLDANGNRLATTGAGGRQTLRTFDALNRLTSVTDVHGNTIGYQYDAVGNVTAITYSDGAVVTYGYDALNRMTRVTDWAGRETIYTYDAAGRLTTALLPDSSTVHYEYDAAGRLLTIQDTAPCGETTFRSEYTLGPSGLRIAETAELPLEAPITTGSRNFTIDAANQLVSDGSDAFSYDADGNMVHGVIGRLPVDLAWDDTNRLVSVGASQYEYDDDGNRIVATVNHRTVRYVQDTNGSLPRVLEEHDEDGNIIARYVHGIGLISRHGLEADGSDGGPFGDWGDDDHDDDDGNGNGCSGERVSVYHFDSRGSTVALTDLDGDVSDRYAYDPYGLVVARDGRTRNPFTYDGRDGVVDDGNGLYFLRARYYEPRLMRFISRDRLVAGNPADTQSLNPYMFARGNPIHGIDPNGQWFGLDDLVMAIGGAVANVVATFVGDLITGEWSSWEDYVGAAVGGAVWGETFLYTGNPWLAGAAGAAASNITAQGLKIASGKQESFDVLSLLLDTALGAALGKLIPGGPLKEGFKKGGSVFTLRMTARALSRNAGTNLAYATQQQFNRLTKRIFLQTLGSSLAEEAVRRSIDRVVAEISNALEPSPTVVTDSALFLWYGPATTLGGRTP